MKIEIEKVPNKTKIKIYGSTHVLKKDYLKNYNNINVIMFRLIKMNCIAQTFEKLKLVIE
jgi:hypothetical protein